MAIDSTAGSGYSLKTGSNIISSCDDFTVAYWFYYSTASRFQCPIGIGGDADDYINPAVVTSTTEIRIWVSNAGNFQIAGSSSTETWYFMYVRGETALNGVRGGIRKAGDTSWTTNSSGGFSDAGWPFTNVPVHFGQSFQTNEHLNGNSGPFYVWNTEIPLADIEAQMWQYQPVRTQDLVAFVPLIDTTPANTYKDYYGGVTINADPNDPTIVSGPPIPWGSPNIKRKRAINARNYAIDMHANATAHSLTIPNTDIRGTARPYNTDYDCGAWEYEAFAPPHFRRRTRFANLLNL